MQWTLFDFEPLGSSRASQPVAEEALPLTARKPLRWRTGPLEPLDRWSTQLSRLGYIERWRRKKAHTSIESVQRKIMDRKPSGSMHRLQCIKTFSIWFSLVSPRGCQVWRKHIFFDFLGVSSESVGVIMICILQRHTHFRNFVKVELLSRRRNMKKPSFVCIEIIWDLLRILANLRYGNAQHSQFAENTDRVSYRIFWSSNGLRVYPATQSCSRWVGAGMMFWAFP